MISIINDIDLYYEIGCKGYDYIIVPTNCYCTFPDGFGRKIRLNYPYVFEEEKKTKYGDFSKLGTILKINGKDSQNFIIMYINKGFNFRPDLKVDFLEYDSLEKAMKRINIEFAGKNIACPLIGCSRFDGNGDREKVIELLYKTTDKINLYVYDYFQKSRNEELIEMFKREEELKMKDYPLYLKTVRKRKEEETARKEKNGTAKC